MSKISSGSESSTSSTAVLTTDATNLSGGAAKRLATTSSVFVVPAQTAPTTNTNTQVKKICTIPSKALSNMATSSSSSSSLSSPPSQQAPPSKLMNILSLQSSPESHKLPIKFISSSSSNGGSDSLSTSPKTSSISTSSSPTSTSSSSIGLGSKVIKISSNGTTSTINLSTTPTKVSPVSNSGNSPIQRNGAIHTTGATSILNAKILTLPATSSNVSSSNGQNKIQYVKIVNTPLSSVNTTGTTTTGPMKITTLTSGNNTQEGTTKPTILTSINQVNLATNSTQRIGDGSIEQSDQIGDVNRQSSFQILGSSSKLTAPVIQRVQPVNYKILTQQLPPTTHQQPSIRPSSSGGVVTTIKSNIVSSNPIVITKTVNNSDVMSNSGDLTAPLAKRHIITTTKSDVKKESVISLKPIAITSNSTVSSFIKPSFPTFNSAPSATSFLTNLADKPTNLKQNIKQANNGATVTNTSNSITSSALNTALNQSLSSSNNNSQNRKPCNCTKSMCLKLYCDCFALGSFCHDCNCVNCFNNLEHEEERTKAINMVLERNPQAFQSKIGKFTAQLAYNKTNGGSSSMLIDENSMPGMTDEIDDLPASRHMKGCNCKKSNCLKRYCECFLAKIQCSTLCKCVGCKNCDESTRTLLQLANAADIRKQQQQQQQNQQQLLNNHSSYLMANQPSTSLLNTPNNDLFFMPSIFDRTEFLTELQQKQRDDKQLLNREYVNAFENKIESSCGRMIETASQEIAKILQVERMSDDDDDQDDENELDWNEHGPRLEQLLLDEFGKCLSEIIQSAEQHTT